MERTILSAFLTCLTVWSIGVGITLTLISNGYLIIIGYLNYLIGGLFVYYLSWKFFEPKFPVESSYKPYYVQFERSAPKL